MIGLVFVYGRVETKEQERGRICDRVWLVNLGKAWGPDF